jgi:lycopene beta-cyclase
LNEAKHLEGQVVGRLSERTKIVKRELENQYDYIISGAGAAGFSLLVRMIQNPFFQSKKILVVDKAPKESNDRTWCFWEKTVGIFEPVVYHRWQQVHFFSNHKVELLDLLPYSYKMIRSIDFYQYVYERASKQENVTFLYGNIEAAGNAGNKGFIVVDGVSFEASFVFNSILFAPPPIPEGKFFLLQHFKGFVVETAGARFNPAVATLMDFRVSQENGPAFVYVLPLSTHRALVEFTMFSRQLLEEEGYDGALRHYIENYLDIDEYKIVEREFGIIPMTNIKYVTAIDRVINIGTAGGQTKGSSGYTFQFVQKHSDRIISDLIRSGKIRADAGFFARRFNLYDSVLLNILSGNKFPADKIFSDLFSRNPVDRVLRFLDNESTLEDEINLMATLPQGPFRKAILEEMFK